MSTTTVEKPRLGGPDSGLGGEWRVIVRNDNHNTFDHVAQTLSRVLPGVSLDQGHRIAEQIHKSYYAPVDALLAEGAADGSLIDVPDREAVAFALFGAVTISALSFLITHQQLDQDRVASAVVNTVLSGLRPR